MVLCYNLNSISAINIAFYQFVDGIILHLHELAMKFFHCETIT
jgi:hypothetical protein